ncbi:MAG: hypothetical protein RLZZ58_1652 [Pseudomonadota bacterium]|jgi:hypothetical protein
MTIWLTLLLAAAPVSVDAARNDYGKCLRDFTRVSLKADKVEVEFNAGLRDACTEKEAVYRDAIIRVDRQDGFTQKEADEDAEEQIVDYLDNFKEKYVDYRETNTGPGPD